MIRNRVDVHCCSLSWGSLAKGFAIALLLSHIAPARAFLPSSERDVLVAIYNSTGGPNWTDHTGWLGKPRTECGWAHVICDSGGNHVYRLQLDSNNLTGTLPAISGLPNAVEINFYNNNIGGTFPALSNLPSLEYFDAGKNQLTGSFPDLSNLPSLDDMDVSDNQMSGSIASLQGAPALRVLDIDFNSFSGEIPAFSGLTSLTEIYFDHNAFVGQLPSLSGLSHLSRIEVSDNQLTGILPGVPFPNDLTVGASSLCPNRFEVRDDPSWDVATDKHPWWLVCDTIFANGFD